MTIERLDSGEILSQAVRHAGVIHVAGMTADDRTKDTRGQTEEILAKIDDRLAKMGSDRSRLLTATIYLADMTGKAEMNAAWQAWLGDLARPARACVGVALATDDTLVEIVVSAAG